MALIGDIAKRSTNHIAEGERDRNSCSLDKGGHVLGGEDLQFILKTQKEQQLGSDEFEIIDS